MPIIKPEQNDPQEEGMLYQLLRQLRGDQSPEELGRQMMQSPKMKVMNGAIDEASHITDNLPNLPPAPPEPGPAELGKQIMEQSSPIQMLLQGRGQSHAQAFRPNPALESQIQSEAKGLMADETARGMPNTARDPNKEKRQAEMMKSFLSNGGGPGFGLKKKQPMSSVHPSQNPFSKPTASEEEQAQAAGAIMQSKIPKAPIQAPVPDVRPMGKPMAAQAPGWSGNPETMEYERAPSRGLSQVAPGQSQGFDIPEMAQSEFGTDQDLYDDPYASIEATPQEEVDPLQEKLLGMIDKENSPQSMQDDRMSQRDLDGRLGQIGQQNADLGFMQLLMRNANQMGTLGGKSAPTGPLDEQVSDMQARNVDAGNNFVKQRMSAKSDQDQRLKSMQFLMKLNQDGKLRREGFEIQRQGFENASADRNAILGVTKGRDANNYDLGNKRLSTAKEIAELNAGGKKTALELQEKNVNSQIDTRTKQLEINEKRAKAAAEKAAKSGDHLPLGMKERVIDISKKQATRVSMINKMKSSLAELKKLKDPKAKFDYAKTMLKMVNSPENPDAVGQEEAKRVGANLDDLRINDIFVGSNPIGKNFPAFEAAIQSQINAMEANSQMDEKELRAIEAQYPSPRGVMDMNKPGARTPTRKFHDKTGKKTRIIYSDGSEEILDGIQ